VMIGYTRIKYHNFTMLHVSAVYSAIFRPIQSIKYGEVYTMGSSFVLLYMIKVPLWNKRPYVSKRITASNHQCFITIVIYLTTLLVATITDYR
jgi:hypothetical protein